MAIHDEYYNSDSRHIIQKVIIYFSPVNILEVTCNNYLVSSTILKELFKYSDSPFGDITSSELSLTLYNIDGIFNPANEESPYYGFIRKGVRIEVYIRPEEYSEWDPFGVYYVTDWSANDMTATITANDAIYNIINGPVQNMPVFYNMPVRDFFDIYISSFGYDVYVDASIDFSIPYIFTSEYKGNKELLTDVLIASIADCFCNNTGEIVVIPKLDASYIRATLTDSNQIISLDITQTITNTYDSSTVEYNTCYVSAVTKLANIEDVNVEVGNNTISTITLNEHPAFSIDTVLVTGKARIIEYTSSSSTFDCNVLSLDDDPISITVYGTKVEIVKQSIGTALEAPITISSSFIQDSNRATTIQEFVDSYIDANMPAIDIKVRGNPTIELGSLLRIDSQRYKLQYYGKLIKASYRYDGGLSCDITLSEASNILEVL